MTTGIWQKAGAIPASPCTVTQMMDNLEQVKKLMAVLHAVWLEGDLLIDFSEKTFWGDDLHPLVEQGLANIGFVRKN